MNVKQRQKHAKIPIVAIVGPTASGKSELAVRLAKKFDGEIISADSRQVYKGLDVGSGKVNGTWRKEIKSKHSVFQLSLKNARRAANYEVQPRKIFFYKTIPHYCIDYISPKKRYTVVDFQHCARQAIEDIHARGKIPFLVGGTGFYIDAVIGNIPFPSVLQNSLLRKKLGRFPAEKLFAMLKRKDPRRAATVDPYNKRRLIRALEIIKKTKGPIPSLDFSDVNIRRTPHNEAILIGIKKDKKILRTAIAKRVRAMLKQGLVAETKKLRSQGLSWKRITQFGFEYRLPALFLQKKISRKELEEQLIKENIRYAKRQMTWWRRHKNIRWVSGVKEAQKFASSVRFNFSGYQKNIKTANKGTIFCYS